MGIAKYATSGSLGIEPSDVTSTYKFNIYVPITCEQPLQGARAVRQEKEGEHATWSSASKKMMWNADLWRWHPWHVFFNVCLYSCSFLLRIDWQKIWQLSQRGANGELEVEFKFQRHTYKPSFLFSPRSRASQRPCSQAIMLQSGNHFNNKNLSWNIAHSLFFVWSPILLLLFMSELHWFCSSN